MSVARETLVGAAGGCWRGYLQLAVVSEDHCMDDPLHSTFRACSWPDRLQLPSHLLFAVFPSGEAPPEAILIVVWSWSGCLGDVELCLLVYLIRAPQSE